MSRRKALGEDDPETATAYNNLRFEPPCIRRGMPTGPAPATGKSLEDPLRDLWSRTTREILLEATATWPSTLLEALGRIGGGDPPLDGPRPTASSGSRRALSSSGVGSIRRPSGPTH